MYRHTLEFKQKRKIEMEKKVAMSRPQRGLEDGVSSELEVCKQTRLSCPRENTHSPTAWGEMSWQKRALKRMRISGKVTQARYCRGRLGCIWA